jgi:IS605 OrfB family transposase
MIRSVTYKLDLNKNKSVILDDLLISFNETIKSYINSFIKELPKYRHGCYRKAVVGDILKTKRLTDNAAMVAYDLVKSYKTQEHNPDETPIYNGNSIKLNKKNIIVQESERTSYRYWLYLPPYRLYLPMIFFENKWHDNNKIMGELTLIKHKKGWFVQISYEVEPQKSNSDIITSIDVGLNSLITTPYNQYGLPNEFKNIFNMKLNQLKKYKAKLQKEGLKTSAKLARLTNKLKAWLKNVKNRIINKFLRTENPGEITLEKLDIRGTKGKRSKSLNHKVSYSGISGLKKIIKGKCEEFGIIVNEVNPAYTSQTCPKCGHICKENRVNDRFKCVLCGFEANADQVGALNVIRRSSHSCVLTKLCSQANRITPDMGFLSKIKILCESQISASLCINLG